MPLDEAIDKTLASLDSSSIVSASTSRAPSGAVNEDSPWLVVTVRGPENEPAALELAWEADLLQGAVTELGRSNETAANQVIAGSTVTLDLPSGEVIDLGGGAGFVALGQTFGEQDISSDEETTARLTEILKTYGLEAQTSGSS